MGLLRSIFSMPRWRGVVFGLLSRGRGSTKAVICRPLKFTIGAIRWQRGFYVGADGRIEGVKLYEGIHFNPSIEFGENVSIQQQCHITCAQSIVVGADTAIAARVTITDIDHPYHNIQLPIERQPIEISPVEIGPECKIYNNAVILRGSRLGRHCVVGANSVVRGIFPDYCIIVGSPGRVVKRYNFATNRWEHTLPDASFLTDKK